LRPGNFLLGTRLSGRQYAFVCYAGTQIEDIEATFEPPLLLPNPLPAASIDNPMFTYRSTFKIENRTLKIHREFVSRVPKQVCPPETEAQISADMDKVRADVNSAYRFGPAVAPAPPAPRPQPLSQVNATVTAGQKRQLAVLFSLNLDCSSMGYATITTVEPVQHGKVAVEHGTGTPNFPQGNPRVECNKPGTEGTVIIYEPNPGFTGPDALVVDIVYADKSSVRRRYSINVNPSREAAATPTNPPGETGPGGRVEPTPPRPASPNPLRSPR
jgi:hypothetical protein